MDGRVWRMGTYLQASGRDLVREGGSPLPSSISMPPPHSEYPQAPGPHRGPDRVSEHGSNHSYGARHPSVTLRQAAVRPGAFLSAKDLTAPLNKTAQTGKVGAFVGSSCGGPRGQKHRVGFMDPQSDSSSTDLAASEHSLLAPHFQPAPTHLSSYSSRRNTVAGTLCGPG